MDDKVKTNDEIEKAYKYILSAADFDIKKSLSALERDLMCVSAVRTELDPSTILDGVHSTYNVSISQTNNLSIHKSIKGVNTMSYAERIDRIMIKSMDFKDLKAWAIKHLKKQLKEEQKGLEFSKSLAIEEIFEKAVYPVGTIREWKGKKYVKVSQGKWMRKYDNAKGRGAETALKNILKKVEAAQTAEELKTIIYENLRRFKDENGKILPEVKQIYELAKKEKESTGKTSETASKIGSKGKSEISEKKEETNIDNDFNKMIARIKNDYPNMPKEAEESLKEEYKRMGISKEKWIEYREKLFKNKEEEKKREEQRKQEKNNEKEEKINKYVKHIKNQLGIGDVGDSLYKKEEYVSILNDTIQKYGKKSIMGIAAQRIIDNMKESEPVKKDEKKEEKQQNNKQGKIPSGYVNDLSIETQGELHKLLREHFKKEGMSGMEIADALDNAMDSKISDLEEIYNKNKEVKELLMNTDSDSSSFKLSDIYDRNTHDEMKQVQSFDEAKNVIKQIADNYGPTEKGRKLLFNFMAYNVGGSNPIYDKLYDNYKVSYNDLDNNMDAAYNKILKLAKGDTNVKQEEKKIKQGADDFARRYREGIEKEDKTFKKSISYRVEEIFRGL